jgi:acyl carrier protein
MDGVARDVIQMLAEERGLPPAKIGPSSRLLEDLGMDGDDAVDFFILLEKRFGTDFSTLHERWGDHFGPEGLSCWVGLVVIAAAFVGGTAAGLLHLGTEVGIAITVALLALWLWVMKTWGPYRVVPITVGQVVEAVETGTWPRRH